MNRSAVIIYSIVDSIIHSFSSQLRPFDPKRRVSTLTESFWVTKERLLFLFFQKEFFFDLSDLSGGERIGSLFQYGNSCRMGRGSLENCV